MGELIGPHRQAADGVELDAVEALEDRPARQLEVLAPGQARFGVDEVAAALARRKHHGLVEAAQGALPDDLDHAGLKAQGCMSSGATSRTCWAKDHWWPSGSSAP